MGETYSESGASFEPLFLEHLIWLLGHPGTWFTLLVWVLCFAGAIKLGGFIKRRKGSGCSAAFIAASLCLLIVYGYALKQAYEVFVRGAPFSDAIQLLNWINPGLSAFALVSLVWIAVDMLKRKRS